ncbi:6-carboxyhexanoate--CoA ligase [Trichloromonas sp.]|uniref:6-carboxyhexanoate--CoA ligase n=1 Tax=Trichloromonas sp. TaxID=3069249 RepID=UPI003D817704
MSEPLYSLRMRSSRLDSHLSGCERLAAADDLERLAAEMVGRALRHPRGRAEQISLRVDLVPAESIRNGRLLDLRTIRVDDHCQGRQAARELLLAAGVHARAADAAIARIALGAAPDGRSMRGAMLVDAVSGARLEADPARGVRASRMDLTAAAQRELRLRLARQGLDNPHVREALVLATKVLAAPEVLAELCWSDDPDYTAGYVATREHGYVRFPHLKPLGEERGGRAFFVRGDEFDRDVLTAFLEHAVLLIDEVGDIGGTSDWKELPCGK